MRCVERCNLVIAHIALRPLTRVSVGGVDKQVVKVRTELIYIGPRGAGSWLRSGGGHDVHASRR